MDEYDLLQGTSLRLKTDKHKKRKKHIKTCEPSKEEPKSEGQVSQEKFQEDAELHGGWWKVDKFEHIKDDVVIEFLPNCYARATSSGSIVLGHPHPPGEGPDEEEIFTAVSVPVNQVAFKSGYGRYLGIDTRKRLVGISEAIGETEMFLPVFEDGNAALCAYNECFLSPAEPETDSQDLMAKAEKVGPSEMLTIRINNNPKFFDARQIGDKAQTEDVGALYRIEEGYLKNHGKTKDSQKEDIKRLKRARHEGLLYEALLDTRVKHKSDKYCK